MFIHYVYPLNPEHPSCSAMGVLIAKDRLRMATEIFLRQNPMGFPPPIPTSPGDPPNCKTNGRAISGSCWTKTAFYFDNPAGVPPAGLTRSSPRAPCF